MTYTDKKPTAPGWYWYREDVNEDWRVIHVIEVAGIIGNERFVREDTDQCTWSLSEGQYAGPIPEPVEIVS